MWIVQVIVVILLIIVALAWFGNRLSANAGKRAKVLFKSTEEKYDNFVKQYLANGIVQEADFEAITTPLKEQVIKVIKPEIDGIFSHINATELSDVKLKYTSPFFQNAVSLSESFFEKRNDNKKELGETERKRFHQAFEEAIEADLIQRINNYKTGYL